MYGDYGYMEEGKLGKPYDFRLLKRLSCYALPYKKTFATALLLTILITLFDLAVPYVTKIAIDRYILASWYRIRTDNLTDSKVKDTLNRYNHLLKKTREGDSYFISNLNMKKLDPADLHILKSRRIVSTDRFYRTDAVHYKSEIPLKKEISPYVLADGSLLVPHSQMTGISKSDLLKLRAGDIRGVTLVAVIFFVLILLSFALSYFEFYLLEFTGQHIMQDIRMTLFQKMQSHAVRFFNHNPVGRLVTRITNDIENLNEMFKSVFVTVFKDIFILTGILIILLVMNWRLALVCFTLIPVIFGLTFLFSTIAREAFRQLRATVSKINSFLQERISGMRIIQLFVREACQMEMFTEINHENFLAGMKQIRVFAIFMPLMELMSSLGIGLVIWYGGGKVIQNQLTLGALVAFIGYIQMFFKPIRDISEKYNIMQSAMASTERIFEFMDLKDEIPEPEIPSIAGEVKGHLEFRNVSFSYEENNPVLHDISFEVKPGETIAIVGSTGSGKTTLVNLIERFYDPDSGSVYLDGIDIRRWPKKKLRNSIGLCMQDVFIYAGSITDNISLGMEVIDEKQVEKAAYQANALQFIQRLPDGFRHEIGEGGSTISAGERQLLSFARALVKNPRILILDEATSSIDPETERLIREAVIRITAKRTTIIIAHRLSTIRHADRILVMHHGRIIEQGNHKQLMNIRGVYYKLNKTGTGKD